MAKANHPHVAKVRDRAEKAGYVETVSTSIDTKGRKQRAKRKAAKRKALPKPESDAESSAAARKAFYLKQERSAAQPEREAPSVIDLAPGEYHHVHADQDIVERALQLVQQMDPDQRQLFRAQLVMYDEVTVS